MRTFRQYHRAAKKTATYPRDQAIIYLALGLAGEGGEVADKLKKVIRDSGGVMTDDMREAILAEAGDCLWYLNMLAHELGSSLADVAQANIDKLVDRQARGGIAGSGDNR